MIFSIAWESLKSRKGSVLLTLLSLIVSVSLLIAVEHIRSQAKQSFSRTISGVDLIIGAPTGQTSLLLYSVFRMGNPSNNIQWESYQDIVNARSVSWVVPISLGDAHKGYRVMGTTTEYFSKFKYGNKSALAFSQGKQFEALFDTVLGYDVAKSLGYELGDSLVISHGVGQLSFKHHDDSPFIVSGILAPTGTPVDKTVHVSLEGLEAMHMRDAERDRIVADIAAGKDVPIEIESVSALFVGLDSRIKALQTQRLVNQYKKEPLLAIFPGVALAELWQLVGSIENLLRVIAGLILVSSLLGMSTMLLTTVRERQRELAVLRAIGAGPGTIFLLIQAEALILTVLAILAAYLIVSGGIALSTEWLSQAYGLFIDNVSLSGVNLVIAGIVVLATFVVACIPAVSAYRTALHQGLIVK